MSDIIVNIPEDNNNTEDKVIYITGCLEWTSLVLFGICYLIGLVVIFEFIILFNIHFNLQHSILGYIVIYSTLKLLLSRIRKTSVLYGQI
mgnify:CR=1 FL=1